MPGGPAFLALRRLGPALLLLLALRAAPPAAAGVSVVAFNPIIDSSTPPWSFKIAFWRDPDLSDTLKERLDYRIYLLSNNLKEALGPDLVQCGYRDIEIYLIDDYRDLLTERGKGEFHLLHCDPAAYLMGRLYPSPGLPHWDPYNQILEEVPPDDPEDRSCGVWVRSDSGVDRLSDLRGAHIAAVDGHCLLGGVLQKASLSGPAATAVAPFQTTDCGSTSDAILRLVTGLATERPIEAAFLPLRSPGVQKARRAMNLKRGENLPIRLLERFDGSALPGNSLLASRILEQCGPVLLDKLTRFLLEQTTPWEWRTPDPQRFKALEETLAPLFGKGGGAP